MKDALAFIAAALVMMLILHANVAGDRSQRDHSPEVIVRSYASAARQVRAEADAHAVIRESEIAKIPLVSAEITKAKTAPESSLLSPIRSGNDYDPECDFIASEPPLAATAETG